MKNCDEMVNSLFERRKQYAAEQKRKRRMLARAVTPVCCFAFAALLSLGMWQSGRLEPPSDPTVAVSDTGTKDVSDESRSEAADSAAENKIIVHRIDGISSGRQNICLLFEDFVAMNKDELNEYYGINVFPEVPDDMSEWQNQQHGIYRRNGGTGEVYFENALQNYSNGDLSRNVNIGLKKGSLPWCDYGILKETEEKSVINGTEAEIGQDANGYYYAQFMYRNVGFQILAEGLTQEEFVAVISSLIK